MRMSSWLKVLSIAGCSLFFSGPALAQGSFYRIYEGALTVRDGNVPLRFRVNDTVVEERLGDPEIPGHGFVQRSISVYMSEGRLSCRVSIYLENGEARSCSGLRFRISNPIDLLAEKQVRGSARLTSSDIVIGTFEVKLKYTEAGDHNGNFDE
ncbi:MAG: hypothetical protein KGP28_10840 [Bdellovibrionales bacterium]|nr:hypothetical protein [Bdellovibrionales bacterium]